MDAEEYYRPTYQNYYTDMCRYRGVCYNERILQRTVFMNKIRMLQWTRKNTIGRRSRITTLILCAGTEGCATTNDATTNEFYSEQF
jgi:hypothetical protein